MRLTLALSCVLMLACLPQEKESPSGSDGSGGTGSGGSSSPSTPRCGQACQDQQIGVALAQTIGLLYNQNLSGGSTGNVDKMANCPLGGTAKIGGSVSASAGVTMVHLTFDLAGCENSGSVFSLAFSGLVRWDGSFMSGANGITSVTAASDALTVAGAIKLFDNPMVSFTCPVSVTQQRSSAGPTTWDGRVCGRELSASSAPSGGGSSGGGSGGSAGSGGSSGGGGSSGTGGPGCPSRYTGVYEGRFGYEWQEGGTTTYGSFVLSITLSCVAGADGSVVYNITQAKADVGFFGCLTGCVPRTGSVATLPTNPPTSPTNPSRPGQGIIVLFPNGTMVQTANSAGAMNVSADVNILSNSADPAIAGKTWHSVNPSGAVFPGDGRKITSWKSWMLDKI